MIANAKNILIVLLIIVLGFFVLSNSTSTKENPSVIIRIDTLIKREKVSLLLF
jgi:uncharacterized protein YxeA